MCYGDKIGPSFSDRDSYTAADLNMGVMINAAELDSLTM